MIVRTYTSAWNLRTKIYAFDDLKVPIKGGITVPQLVAGIGVGLVWIPFCFLINLPGIVGGGFAVAIMVLPPIVTLMKADTPVKHEKTIEEWATSWMIRTSEPRKLAGMTAARDDRPIVLSARRWVPKWGDDYGHEPTEAGR